jgi:hypothetical protein
MSKKIKAKFLDYMAGLVSKTGLVVLELLIKTDPLNKCPHQ